MSVEKAGKIGVEVSGTAGVTASVILAEVKAEYSVKVVAEVGVTVGHTYTHDIPAKKYGHLQYGSRGTVKLPTREVGWRYGLTSS
ncbi:hypothetical protein ACFVW5_38805 [Streptomyces sp. NPDC058232]|uniref:hypothetical protein n=1 Tax=Streptomyces sp. NPDC058232 TaxID=3346393 RepID=UPI0036E2C49D